MVFSLEALRARHGDSLLLHYGDPADPRLIVIDGGPSGVSKDALLPRLEALRDERDGLLAIEILMVSHIDNDHVRGVLDFGRALDENEPPKSGFDVKTLWLNSFEDTVGDGAPITASANAVPAGVEEGQLQAVVASVNEGRSLRDLARKLGWPENAGFDGLVIAPDDSGKVIDLDPLRLTVVGPRAAELEKLREEWAEQVAKLANKEKPAAEVAEYLDKSVFNLSSIVCLAELGDKRMLLTGDARGDKIIEGLKAADLLEDGKLTVDLLKVPHHGSSRNLKKEFFETVRASKIVISADGEHHNPDLETLEMISAARPDDEFTLYLTYRELKKDMGPIIHGFLEAEAKGGRTYKTVFRPDDELSLRVDL
jgi:hypothetical protein